MTAGYAGLGMAVLVACAVLVGAGVLVARRLNRRDARSDAADRAWSEQSTLLVERLHGATFERVTFDAEDPQLVFLNDFRAVVTVPWWPAVVVGSRVLRIGDPGYRQAVASLQGDTVLSARTSAEHEVVLELSRGSFLIEPRPPAPRR